MLTRLRGTRVWRERGAAVAGLAVLAASVVVLALVVVAVTTSLTKDDTRFGTERKEPDNRLVENGLVLSPRVGLEAPRADATGYCLVATHDNLPGRVLYVWSETGVVSDEPCI